jgi:hypothetical protein
MQGCLDGLAAGERRVLVLRAGLGAAPALSRSDVARRLGLPVPQTGRIERRGLRRLEALDGAGRCDDGRRAAASPFGVDNVDLAGGSGLIPVGDGRAEGSQPRSGVAGVSASGGGGGDLGDALPPPIGDGSDWTVLILLTLLAMVGLLVRRELRRH